MPRKFIPLDERKKEYTLNVSLPQDTYIRLRQLKTVTHIPMKKYIETWVRAGVDYEFENDCPIADYIRKEKLEKLKRQHEQ